MMFFLHRKERLLDVHCW